MSKIPNETSEWGYEILRRAIDAAGVSLWKWNVETDDCAMDDRGYRLWEVSPGPELTFEHLSAKIHPADRDRVLSDEAVRLFRVDRPDITEVTDLERAVSLLGQARIRDLAEEFERWVESGAMAAGERLLPRFREQVTAGFKEALRDAARGEHVEESVRAVARSGADLLEEGLRVLLGRKK